MYQKLSILVPCFNEAKTIARVIEKLHKAELYNGIDKEIIVIDDGSTDNTFAILQPFLQESGLTLKVATHENNQGKGASIRSGIEIATGEIIVIQDADLEYDPEEYNKLLKPICDGHADVVYGSRFMGEGPHRVLFFFHTIGNKILTFLSNLFTQLNLTDMETGFKMFKAQVLKQVTIEENRFGFEPEVTAKISRIKGIRIYEVGISYYGRGYEEGKKINWKDGIRAVYCIFKYNIFRRSV